MITTQIQIESITVDELRKLISDAVKDAIIEDRNSFRPEQKKERELLKIGQAAELIGISTTTLSRWTKLGVIQSKIIGKHHYYPRIEIETCLRNQFEKVRTGRPPKYSSF